MRYSEIVELYDPQSSFPLEWDDSFAPQDYHATAHDRQGRSIDISFVQIRPDITEIEFQRGGSFDVTGRGDAPQVFATVLEAIKQYLSKQQPKIIVFSAKEGSRYSLYQSLVKRFAGSSGYQQFDISKLSDRAKDKIGASGTNVIVLRKSTTPLAEHKTSREEFEGMTIEMTKNGHVLVINALDDWGNNILGHVAFNIGDDDDLDPQELEVDERYQGQGIARVMYDYAKSKGYTIHRSYDQTDAGRGFWNKHRGEDVRVWEGVAEDSAEAYKEHLIKTLPKMMKFLSKNVKGWRPSEEQMLAAVDTAYMVMKHTGDVKQAGKALQDELNTLHRMNQGQQGVAEARGLAPTKPYDDLLANMGFFMSLNTVKIQQDAVDNTAQQELAVMQQQFRKPILNGMTFFDVHKDMKLTKDPRVAPILLKYVYDMLGYIEPRIKKYVQPAQQQKYLARLDQIKNDYRAAVAQVSEQTVAENFHDGRNPQDKGDSKRYGVPTKASVSTLRKVAKQGGRKGQLAHWMANMKAGRAKARRKG